MQYKNSLFNMPSDKGSLTVRGVSSLNIESDMAKINVRISSQDKSLEIAKDKNSEILNRLLDSLSDYGVSKDDIFSKDISATQNYDYEKNALISYTVTQLITIIVHDLSKVNDIYSLVVENGANDEIYIDFSLSNPNEYYNKALKKATQDAKDKASILAKNFSLNYNPIPCKVTEVSSQLNNINYSSKSSSTNVVPGIVKITAQVDASFLTYCM